MLCFSRDFGMWGGVGRGILNGKSGGILVFMSDIRDYVEKWGGCGDFWWWNFGRDGMRESGKYADLLGDLEGRDWIVKSLSKFESSDEIVIQLLK